ncbi:MAG TPA: flagellin [Paracoccaceae bacterium]|nr:flagellin [Paracoccaceae bacterium]
MTSLNTGDLAQSLLLRRQNSALKTDFNRLTQEMTSGRQADLGAALKGDFKVLAGIEHSLTVLQSFDTAASEARIFATTQQTTLDLMQTLGADLAPVLSGAGTSGGATHVSTAAHDARQKFFSAVSALNVRVGDRYVFSGDATDQKPILGAQDILDQLTTAIAGQVTASGVTGAIDAWFNAPPGGGGYLDTVYGGSPVALAPFRIGEGEEASLTLSAADPTLREALKGLALGAMVAEGALPGDLTGQALLLKTAGQSLLASVTGLASLQANLGSTEGHIAAVTARNGAEGSALGIARNELIAADPFETANELEAVKTQLETLYALTARLSRLNLADFLR